MKWMRTLVLFNKGGVAQSRDWQLLHESYLRSIKSIDFPEGSGSLLLRRKVGIKSPSGKVKWQRNGVGYLRSRFLSHLVGVEGWKPESRFDLGKERVPPEVMLYPELSSHHEPMDAQFGEFDFVTTAPDGTHVAIEWETGNISSSHRSLNKLVIALMTGKVQAGVLIVPTRDLYEHLTDRIGNIRELSVYLSLWQDIGALVERGLLAISVVEHDALTDDVSHAYLPTGKDGNAEKE